METLATVPLFSACSKKELQMVAKSAERLAIPAGKVVVTEGAAGTEFFVIIDGHARVERHGREVATLGPGAFFGDLALLDRAPRNASVIADSELAVARIGQRAFDTLLDQPGFSKKLLAGLARRLREQDARNA
jgi:CRP/FNR family cyclic AMP-dependent transcriptional regulator